MPGLPNINRGVSIGRMFPSGDRASNINYGGYVSGAGVGAVSRSNRRALKKRAVLVQEMKDGKLVGRNCGCAARNAELEYLAGNSGALPAWATGSLTNSNIHNYVDLWITNPNHEVFTDPDSSGYVGPIGLWDTSAVTDMSELFKNKTTFNDDIFNWDVSNVTTMRSMFDGATSFNQRLGNTASEWQTGNVLDMSFMFRGATSFNAGAAGLDTDNQIFSNVTSVTTMESMFAGATSYNGGGQENMAFWEPAACTNFKNMFSGASIVGTSAGGQVSLSLSQWSSHLLYTSINANLGFANMLLGSGYLDGTVPRYSSYTGSATPAPANNVGDWETLWTAAPP